MTNTNAGGDAVGLLVLGMHRSGTSAAIGLLDKLGIPASGELLPAEHYNEKGLFENKAVNLFHNRLLAHLGSAWDDPMPVSNAFVATPVGAGFVAELADIIRDELLAAAPIFAVKDPRMCRFIPLWTAAFAQLGVQAKVIIPLRHPLDVAGSLASRDQFPRAKSFLLWLDHTLAAESQTRNLPRSFISYDALLSDWRGVSDKLAADLQLVWPKERGRVENAVDQFLTRDLRHHANQAEIGEATPLDALVSRSFAALQTLAENASDAQAQQILDEARQELLTATDVLSPYVAWEFSELAEARVEVDRLQFQETALRQERASFEVAVRTEMRKSEAAHREILKEFEGERDDLRHQAERGAHFEREADHLRGEVHELRGAIEAMRASTSWRLLAPLRRVGGALPPSTRTLLRRTARTGWWAITPWRMPARLRYLEERHQRAAAQSALANQPADAASLAYSDAANLAPVPSGPAHRGSSTQPPLNVFAVPAEGAPGRVSMVTDSINEGSLFGGVATALIFTALLAKRTGRRLRIVSRTQAPAAENVAIVFRAHGIDWNDNIEFVFADLADATHAIDMVEDEWFVTTSWWTTESTRQSVSDAQILYILQEDERMFYPFGDDYLACSEVISDRSIRKVVNSQLLHRHLANDGIVGDETPFFEPSFPERIYFPEPGPEEEKRKFFFYARPNNARNLYDRGLAVIETALERGILDPEVWDIHFVGKDLAPMTLSGGIEPILLQNLAWEDYAAFVRSVDLALTLMYTPHPSYPPLDVAACGGVAVTNSFGMKTDLSHYSRSIICVDSDVDTLVEGLRLGIERAMDREGRQKALADSHIGRDWTGSFAPVFERLLEGERLVS